MMLLLFTDDLQRSHRYDPELARLADRHYSRGKIGSPQFCPPGENLVLRDSLGLVVFVWIKQGFRLDSQTGYYCSLFRNESRRLSSEIILEAEQVAFSEWGGNRLFTFIDPKKVRSPNPGYCFKIAGWKYAGLTKYRRLVILAKERAQ